jgi:hypothetical protein
MVNVLQRSPSFGEVISQGVGSGLAKGADIFQQLALQSMLEKQKAHQRENLVQQLEGPGQSLTDKFVQSAQHIKNTTGQELNNEEMNDLWDFLSKGAESQSPSSSMNDNYTKAKKAALAGEHDLSSIYRSQAEQEARKQREEERFKFKREESEKSIFKPALSEYFSKIEEQRDKLPLLESSLDAQLNSVLSGDVDPWSRGHVADIAKSLGVPSSVVAPLETPGSKGFKTGLKTYLSNTLKEAFRGTTTGREIDLAESLLAQAGVSKEGNLASIWLLQAQKDITQEKIRLADELREEGYPTQKIPKEVDKRLVAFRKNLTEEYMEALNELRKK